jgi:hypothetical protein
MRFSEADGPWQPIPLWVDFLIRCGFAWAKRHETRKIIVISMPCESGGAALVALGALRRRLALDDANDSLSHFQRIEKLAARRDNETVLQHKAMKGRFRLDGRDKQGIVWARQEVTTISDNPAKAGPVRRIIIPSNAHEWKFEREAPTQVVDGAGLPYGAFYQHMVEGAPALLESNLRQSDSAICLASRVTGGSVSRSFFAAMSFGIDGQQADAAQLLTIHKWSPDTISRVTFFNSRTGELDRNAGSVDMVIADGDGAFLKVLDEFPQSDIVGVIHRTAERDKLEAIGTRLAALSQQWYAPDADILNGLPPAPTGITIGAYKRRQA